jgi:hypothetical protein
MMTRLKSPVDETICHSLEGSIGEIGKQLLTGKTRLRIKLGYVPDVLYTFMDPLRAAVGPFSQQVGGLSDQF